jgi:hypothetical protein
MLLIGDIVFVGVYRFRVHRSGFTVQSFPMKPGSKVAFLVLTFAKPEP